MDFFNVNLVQYFIIISNEQTHIVILIGFEPSNYPRKVDTGRNKIFLNIFLFETAPVQP